MVMYENDGSYGFNVNNINITIIWDYSVHSERVDLIQIEYVWVG